MLVVCQVVYDVVQRIVHHVVEVERREARVEVGGNGRGADLAMPSARAAASCAASLRTGVHRHARETEIIFMAPSGLFAPINDTISVLVDVEKLDWSKPAAKLNPAARWKRKIDAGEALHVAAISGLSRVAAAEYLRAMGETVAREADVSELHAKLKQGERTSGRVRE
jgi:hypothetical protein